MRAFHRACPYVLLTISFAAAQQAPLPSGPIYPGGSRDYIVPVTTRMFQLSAPNEPPDGSSVSYTSFDNKQYTVTQYNGRYVAFLIQPASLALGRYTVAQLREFIDHLDVLYAHFFDVMGSEPPGSTPLLHIAFVPTCGGGCGYVGLKGIELAPEMVDPAHGEYPDGSPYLFAIHEMTHNYDFYSSYVMYGPDSAHAWTDFMNFYISVYNQEGEVNASGAGDYPARFLQSYINKNFGPYLAYPSHSWAACVRDNTCDPANSMGQHAQGGMVLRIAQMHGPLGIPAFVQYLSNAITTRNLNASQMDVLTKNDLLLESLANGEQVNLACYVDFWNWPISSTLRSQLQTRFNNNANCLDQDGDGYSVVGGDTNDMNATIHPGATEIADGMDHDSDGIVDDLLVQETIEFGQTVANASAIPFPARILGAIVSSTDSDTFKITLSAPTHVRFSLKSLDAFQGWLFVNKQDNTWLQFEYVGSKQSSDMDISLAAGTWIFSVAYNTSSNTGNYQVLVYPTPIWPSSLTAPNPAPAPGGAVTLATPVLPANLQAISGLSARFWVVGLGWVGTQPLTNGSASLTYTPPRTAQCLWKYRVEFISGTLPMAPTSASATFSSCVPDLTITKVHSGNFLQGQAGGTYTITVFNAGTGPTTDAVVVQDMLPTGLTATAMTGPNWTCNVPTLMCTRADAIAAGSSYDPITLTVNVSNSAPNSVTNVATVSGGGEIAASNNTANDVTLIGSSIAALTLSSASTVGGKSTTGNRVTLTSAAPPGGLVVTLSSSNSTVVSVPASVTIPSGAIESPSFTITTNPVSVSTPVTITASYGASAKTMIVTVLPPLQSGSTVVLPASGSGSSQAFTFTYTDPNGYQDISGSQIIINSTTSGAGACYILFGRGSNGIALADDAGNPGPLTTLGAPTVLQNSECSVLASISSQSFSGNTVSLAVYVVFKPAFAGAKTVFTAFSTNGGVSSGLQPVGTFTATANTTPISAVSVTSASGTGHAQVFTFDYFDPNGYPNSSGSQVLFSHTTSAVGQCYILFGRGTNQIALADDTGTNFTLTPLGGQTVLQNSQCSVFAANSFQSGRGTDLFLTLFVAFKPSFAGAKNIYSGSTDNGGNRSAFVPLGTWIVPATPPALAVNSVTPSAATGPSNPLTFVFSDPNGFTDISGAQLIVNPILSTGAGSCYIQFARSGLIALAGDDGVSTTTANLGQPTFLQNSQCIVNAAASYQAGTGNYLSLTLFITMKTPGGKNVYASGSSNGGGTSGFSQLGTWNVTSPSVLTPVAVSPGTGAGPAGTPQVFTFTYSDPNGASDISGSQIIINPALQGAFSCYVLYGRGTNVIAIANDTASGFANGILGTAGILQNSQCSIDLSKSFQVQTGNTVNLTLAVNFMPSYKGLMYAFSNVVNNAANASSFPALGTFLVH